MCGPAVAFSVTVRIVYGVVFYIILFSFGVINITKRQLFSFAIKLHIINIISPFFLLLL